jgi:hypothetical protein
MRDQDDNDEKHGDDEKRAGSTESACVQAFLVASRDQELNDTANGRIAVVNAATTARTMFDEQDGGQTGDTDALLTADMSPKA